MGKIFLIIPVRLRFILMVALASLGILFINYSYRPPQEIVVPERFDFVWDKSEIGSKDDPQARYNYHLKMQADPKTGQVPWGIYPRELEFTAKIPSRKASDGTNLRTKQDDWQPLGPNNVGGRTRAFGVDVTDASILVAGSVSGGMWRSEDGGISWTQTSSTSNLAGTTALAQDRREGKENTWYYGTGEIRGNSARAPGAPYRGDGIFKSTDGARSWTQLASTQVEVRNRFNSQFNYIYSIVPNHTKTDIDEVYVALYGGILRSQDGGNSWEVSLGDALFDLGPEEDLNGSKSPFFTELKLSANGVFYAYLSDNTSSGYIPEGGVFRSVDGNDWTDITPRNLPDSSNRAVMSLAPTNENILYMLVEHGVAETHSLWKYTHSDPVGEWEDMNAGLPSFEDSEFGNLDTQGSYNMVIETHPNDEDIVFFGGTNLYRSLDGLRSTDNLEWIAGYDTTDNGAQWPQHHADQHFLHFQKESPFRLYSTHDGGISFTDASTIPFPVWLSLNGGYITSQFYAIGIQMDEPSNFITGGMQDNGSWFGGQSNLANWNRLIGGDGGYTAIGEESRFWYVSAQNGRIFRLIIDFEEGKLTSLSQVDPEGAGENGDQDYLFINPFVLDPNDTDRMYVAGGDAIWRNHNLAQIPGGRRDPAREGWELLENTVLRDSGQVSNLIVSIDIPNRVYYGTSDGRFFRIDNAQKADGDVRELTSPLFPKGAYLSSVNMSPDNADNVVVTFSNYNVQSIFASFNGGLSFESISGNLEEFPDGDGNGPSVRWAVIAPLSNGNDRYYAGTSSGLFSTENLNGNQTEWLREGAESVGQSIVNMLKYRPLDGRIVAATHGSGVFLAEVDGFKPIEPVGQTGEPFGIDDAYPNPFNEITTLEYTLPEAGIVLARVIDVSGRWVKTALWGTQLAGTNHISWNGTNNLGQPAPEGIYMIHILYKDKSVSRRVILTR